MADRIVVDTGPLIAVARAQAMHVLGALPFEFICPPQVRAELDRRGALLVGEQLGLGVELVDGHGAVEDVELNPGEPSGGP